MIPGPQLIDWGNPVADAPLNRDRKAWWYGLPNNSGGTRWFDLCRGATLTLTNGPLWTSTAPCGGSGLALDGSNDYATGTSPTAMNVGTGEFTVAFWALIPSGATTNRWMLANTSGGGVAGIDFLYGGGGAGRVWVRAGGGSECEFNGGYNDGVWRRFVGLRRGNSLILYANGVPVRTVTNTNSASATGSLQVGARAGASTFGGSMADVGMWSRALSADEVWADYVESRQGYPTALRRFTPKTWGFLGRSTGGGGGGFRAAWLAGRGGSILGGGVR